MFDVTASLTINASREKVAAFAMEPDNFPKFMEGVKSVEVKSRPLDIGSKVVVDADPGGKKSKPVTYSFILYTVGYAMRFKYLDGTFPAETTYVFEETENPNQTLVKIRTKEKLEGLNKIASPFLKSAAKANAAKNLAKLKNLVERG